MNPDVIAQQVPLALLLVFVQNWLRNQPWFPILTQDKTRLQSRLNHIFAIVASGAATVGVHFTLNATQHQLIIDWPTTTVFLTGLWHWITQYLLAKTSYHALADKLPTASTSSTSSTSTSTSATVGGK